jgi:hypothetical protein
MLSLSELPGQRSPRRASLGEASKEAIVSEGDQRRQEQSPNTTDVVFTSE